MTSQARNASCGDEIITTSYRSKKNGQKDNEDVRKDLKLDLSTDKIEEKELKRAGIAIDR